MVLAVSRSTEEEALRTDHIDILRISSSRDVNQPTDTLIRVALSSDVCSMNGALPLPETLNSMWQCHYSLLDSRGAFSVANQPLRSLVSLAIDNVHKKKLMLPSRWLTRMVINALVLVVVELWLVLAKL